jgi:DNA-binding XRE family transcriptional regulator
MPFEKINPIAEAIELQEMFKDEPKIKELFRQYELAHRENARLAQKEQELRQRLIDCRKAQHITQRELVARTGLTQQAISRFETGIGGSMKTILKYAEGIGCDLIPQMRVDNPPA